MSYHGRLVIKEPTLRWPIIVAAAIMTAAMVVVVVGLYYLAIRWSGETSRRVLQLETTLRPGNPEFERYRHQIAIAALLSKEKVDPLNNLALEMTGIIKNNTGKSISGLEMRGVILDHNETAVHERTVVIIPERQMALEPNEEISVRVLLENIDKGLDRERLKLEVTGLSFAQS
jgi:hypothetical protein